MMTACVVLGLFIAYLVAIGCMLWRDAAKAERRHEHVCVFDAGIVEMGEDVLMFCTCGNTRLIVRGRVIR